MIRFMTWLGTVSGMTVHVLPTQEGDRPCLARYSTCLRDLLTSLQVGSPSSFAMSETSRMKNLHAEGAPLPLSNWQASSAPDN